MIDNHIDGTLVGPSKVDVAYTLVRIVREILLCAVLAVILFVGTALAKGLADIGAARDRPAYCLTDSASRTNQECRT